MKKKQRLGDIDIHVEVFALIFGDLKKSRSFVFLRKGRKQNTKGNEILWEVFVILCIWGMGYGNDRVRQGNFRMRFGNLGCNMVL